MLFLRSIQGSQHEKNRSFCEVLFTHDRSRHPERSEKIKHSFSIYLRNYAPAHHNVSLRIRVHFSPLFINFYYVWNTTGPYKGKHFTRYSAPREASVHLLSAAIAAVTVGGVALLEQIILVGLLSAVKIRCGQHIGACRRGTRFSQNSEHAFRLFHLLRIVVVDRGMKSLATGTVVRQAALFEEVLQDFVVRNSRRIENNSNCFLVVQFIREIW